MIEHLNQIAIHAFYAGEHDAGSRACEKLLSLPDLPQDLERQTRANRTWYTRTLGDLVPAATFRRIEIDPARHGWSVFNPTILADGDGFWAIVRSSNYSIDASGRYVIPPDDGEWIRTENLLCRLDRSLEVTSRRLIVPPAYEPNGFPVQGLEDCRLRRTARGIGVSATVRDAAPWTGQCRIGVCDLDTGDARLHGLRVLEWDGLAAHEKNWMPIDGQDAWLYASRHAGHAMTVRADPDLPGVYEARRHAESPILAGGFRGGGQLVPVRGGWLAIVHEVAVMDTGRRAYEHRFVWFDADFRLARWSPLFAFRETRAIEFAAGLAAVDGRIVVSFGVRDAEAWLCDLQEDELCRLLAPVS